MEFNSRFGDPETQVVLDRLATPLAGLLHVARSVTWDTSRHVGWHGRAVTVVMRLRVPRSARQGDMITIKDLPSMRPTVRGLLLHASTAPPAVTW